jgi:mono/diheme cytochrome c family protein
MRKASLAIGLFAAVVTACAAQAPEDDATAETTKEDAPVGDAAHGKELYDSPLGCNVCHGPEAKGELGPNIRQTSIENVYHALQNFPDMMNWQFNNPELFEEQNLLDIVAYLNTLERDPGPE